VSRPRCSWRPSGPRGWPVGARGRRLAFVASFAPGVVVAQLGAATLHSLAVLGLGVGLLVAAVGLRRLAEGRRRPPQVGNPTAMAGPRPRTIGLRRVRLRAGLLLAVAALILAARPARAQMMVTDLKAIAQAVTQVNQGLQQIQALRSQLTNQAAMLQHLGADVTGPLFQIDQQATSLLRNAQGLGYASTNLSTSLAAAYPTNLEGRSLSDISGLLTAWNVASRRTLQDALQAQNQVALGQPITTEAVRHAVAASQSVAGQTAAIQSTNQLLASLSSQLTQLQTLLIAEQRQTQTLALQQQALTAKAQADSAAGLAHRDPAPHFTADSL
jgi:P-type conjugative transfer protein TrbJ